MTTRRMGHEPAHLGHMVDQDRPDEVPLTLVGRQQLGTLLLRILHQALNEVGARLADHGGDCAVVLQVSYNSDWWQTDGGPGAAPGEAVWSNDMTCSPKILPFCQGMGNILICCRQHPPTACP